MLIFRFSSLSGRFEIVGVKSATEIPRGFFRPPVDISFHELTYTVRVDLPGITPENLLIEAGEAEVSIAGVLPPPEQAGPCRLMERASGSFKRTIQFPRQIVADKIEAILSNGVLTMSIPVPEEERYIPCLEIKIEGAD